MAERQQALAQVVLQDPAVESLSSFIGVDGINTTLNSGRMLINLKPLAKRDASAVEVIRRLQSALADVHGITLYMQSIQDLTIEDRVSRTQYQFTVEDANAEELSAWLPKLVDRATASRLGITPAVIDNALYNAFGQRLVSTIFTQTNQYRVVLEVKPEFQRGPAALSEIYVPAPASGAAAAGAAASPIPGVSASATGGAATASAPASQQIPLSSIAKVIERPAQLAVNHIGQFPSATVSFNLARGASLGHAVSAIEGVERELGMPASVQIRFQGAANAFRASLANEVWLILAAIVTMYIVLGVLYESYIHPVTILSTLPSAGVGALLALMLAGQDLSRS